MKVIFDIEASCDDKNINPYYNMETIEIGAVKVAGTEVIEEFQTFVKPEYVDELTPFCMKLTGITYDDLKHAPTFNEAILKFYSFIYGCKIYSCGEFDRKFLVREISEKGVNFSHELAKNAINASHVNLKSVYNVITGDRMKGMNGMAKKLNVMLDGKHHRGLDDARNLTKIYLKLEKIREETIMKEINHEDMKRIIKGINLIHDEKITISNDYLLYRNEDKSLIDFIDDWKDVILKDYESNENYIRENEYKVIKRMGLND